MIHVMALPISVLIIIFTTYWYFILFKEKYVNYDICDITYSFVLF